MAQNNSQGGILLLWRRTFGLRNSRSFPKQLNNYHLLMNEAVPVNKFFFYYTGGLNQGPLDTAAT
jgi:hypothetical protein